MSYEGKMLQELEMPSRKDVSDVLLKVLFKHKGVIKEFGEGETIVDEIANYFNLTEEQREAYLTTIYKKENRVKKSYLWHRLLFRAADELANLKLISRPTQTLKLTNKREWMLLEKGFDKAMKLLDIPEYKKEFLPIKSYEVQKIVKKLTEKSPPSNYQPFDKNRKISKVNRTYSLRKRGFRQAVMEAYDYKCAICGLKLNSPNLSIWEVEAAHIVPHSVMGKDDLWNGISLCRFHHWAFDVGWFTILSDYTVKLSNRYKDLPKDYGRVLNFDFLGDTVQDKKRIILPNRQASYPHQRSIRWHQQNVFNNERD